MTNAPVRRVLMTGDTAGGVWTFTLELAEALAAQGVEIALATFGGMPTAAQRADVDRIPGLQLHATTYKLEWMDDPWDDVEASGDWLLRLHHQLQPDVVHLNSFGHGTLAWNAPVVMTAHSCVLSWWSAVKNAPLPATWQRYRSEVEYALKAVDLVAAPSRAMLGSLVANYGSDLPPSRVILNGRNAARFQPASKEPFIFAAGRIWDEGKTIAAIASVAPR